MTIGEHIGHAALKLRKRELWVRLAWPTFTALVLVHGLRWLYEVL